MGVGGLVLGSQKSSMPFPSLLEPLPNVDFGPKKDRAAAQSRDASAPEPRVLS